jgi:SAM-dependent methyltransferase
LTAVVSQHPELESWPGHLAMRIPELRTVVAAAGLQRIGRLLELGCGNGLASAYLAPHASQVVATDLPMVHAAIHSIGLSRARHLFSLLDLPHVSAVGCPGEALPFANDTFDVVFSHFVLEHLRDRAATLRESLRVLKPGGRFIAAVPARALSAIYPLCFYSDLARRVMRRAWHRLRPAPPALAAASHGEAMAGPGYVVTNWTGFRQAYPHFPWPTPHGEFATFGEEFRFQRPSNWVALCRASGFTAVQAIPLSVIPRGLFEVALGGGAGARLYRRLFPLEERLCGVSALTGVAQEICLVAEKGSRA